MRAFIALNLPKKERDRIHRATRFLREGGLPMRWVDSENFHVTLKFLGEVRPERIPGIEGALEKVGRATAPFTLALGGFGAFPTIRRPSVIWLGVTATPELRCLKQDLEWALSTCGFDTETHAFHPHLTLARANSRDGAGVFRGLDETVAAMTFEAKVQVRSVDLMRTRLSRGGAHYNVLAASRLIRGG